MDIYRLGSNISTVHHDGVFERVVEWLFPPHDVDFLVK